MKLPTRALACFAIALPVALCALPSRADPVQWVTWASAIAGPNGSAVGQLTLADGSSIGVSYRGDVSFWAAPSVPSYWAAPAGTYTSEAVDNGPVGGMVALSRTSTKTLSFSAAVENLFFAVTNLDGQGYEFSQDFTIESNGPGPYGSGTLSKVVTPEGRYRLVGSGASHGVIHFNQPLSSITFSSWANTHWSGLTVGTYGAASPVPEPGSYAMMMLGLLGVASAVTRRLRPQSGH